jgi:NAD-dependent deacetylase
VVALTGAGVSTPSGIPDFRSTHSGLWTEHDPFEVASIFAFRTRPEAFYSWLHPLARLTIQAIPNAAHQALATLETWGPLRALITQNIDMLHHKAGSANVVELHGHMRRMTCLTCYAEVTAEPYLRNFLKTRAVPHCPCGGVFKPNVILFGEQLPVRALNAAKSHTRKCDLMIVAGSSLQVAPAGDLPALAKSTGSRLLIINQEVTPADVFADVVIHEDVVRVLPLLAEPFVREQA